MLSAMKRPPVFTSQCCHAPGEERNNIENILFLGGDFFFQQIFSREGAQRVGNSRSSG